MEGKVKTYQTGVRSDNEYADCPDQAEFGIDLATARKIFELAGLVQANGLYKVERFDYRVRWLKVPASGEAAEEVAADADTLRVSANEFWFGAYLKHASEGFVTERQSIADLAAFFALATVPAEPTRSEDRFVAKVAGLSLWNWSSDAGEQLSECDPPPDGELDSHACLMGLIEQARMILTPTSGTVLAEAAHG